MSLSAPFNTLANRMEQFGWPFAQTWTPFQRNWTDSEDWRTNTRRLNRWQNPAPATVTTNSTKTETTDEVEHWSPQYDWDETETQLRIVASLPGVSHVNVRLRTTPGRGTFLTFSGNVTNTEQGETFSFMEQCNYVQSLRVPEGTTASDMTYSLDHGLFRLTVNKRNVAQPTEVTFDVFPTTGTTATTGTTTTTTTTGTTTTTPATGSSSTTN